MIRKNFDIVLVMVLALVSAALVLLQVNIDVVRIPIGFLMIFILPGYAFSVFLFPSTPTPLVERIASTIGLSLVITVIGGLLLFAVSVPLKPESWVLYETSVILLTGIGGIIQRFRIPGITLRRKSDTRPRESILILPSAGQLLLLAISASIILIGIASAQQIAESKPGTVVVQLWMLPAPSTTGQNVQLGILTNDSAPQEFFLWLERGGYTIQTWPHLSLTPNKKWEVVIPINSGLPGTGPLEAFLYVYNQPNIPYRHVDLWLDQSQIK
jgi:uncharacterized membrane protein